MNNILFVSVFKNIGRDNWNAYFQRSQNNYINSFLKLTHIKYDMLVFVEKDVYDHLKNYNLSHNIQLIVDDFQYFNELLPQFQKVMESQNYQNLIPSDRKLYCEHSIPAYNVIMALKFFYIKKAKEMFEIENNYKYYAWIDFGYIKNENVQVPSNINFEKLRSDKILYLNHYKIDEDRIGNKINKILPQELLSYYHVYICGNVFIVPNNLVSDLFNRVESKIYELLKMDICDDDQNLILQVYYDHPEMFDLVYDESKNWYYIFDKYLNTEPVLPHIILTDTNNLLNETLNKYNWQYTYIQKQNKENEEIKVLSQLHENQIVILLNTTEIYCLRSPKAFKEAFQSFGGGKVIIGMEITGNCSFTFSNPINEYWKKQNLSELPIRQYSTNIIAGYVKDVRKIFSENLINFINNYPNEVKLDVNAEIFHISNFGLNAGILNIHTQKNDSPTFAELFGRGAFFLILPNTHLKGQKVISKFVKLMLENNANDETLRENYNYPEPSWNEHF